MFIISAKSLFRNFRLTNTQEVSNDIRVWLPSSIRHVCKQLNTVRIFKGKIVTMLFVGVTKSLHFKGKHLKFRLQVSLSASFSVQS